MNQTKFRGTLGELSDAKIVQTALENPEYTWRTIGGIIAETGLDYNRVWAAFQKLAEDGILCTSCRVSARDGQDLHMTRDKYSKTATFWDKVRSGIAMRVY